MLLARGVFWRAFDVLLRVDADQVAAHRVRDGHRVRRDLVPREEDHLLSQRRDDGVLRALKHQRDHLWIGFCLVVRQDNDVVAIGDQLRNAARLVDAEELRPLEFDQRPEEIVRPLFGARTRRLTERSWAPRGRSGLPNSSRTAREWPGDTVRTCGARRPRVPLLSS